MAYTRITLEESLTYTLKGNYENGRNWGFNVFFRNHEMQGRVFNGEVSYHNGSIFFHDAYFTLVGTDNSIQLEDPNFRRTTNHWTQEYSQMMKDACSSARLSVQHIIQNVPKETLDAAINTHIDREIAREQRRIERAQQLIVHLENQRA